MVRWYENGMTFLENHRCYSSPFSSYYSWSKTLTIKTSSTTSGIQICSSYYSISKMIMKRGKRQKWKTPPLLLSPYTNPFIIFLVLISWYQPPRHGLDICLNLYLFRTPPISWSHYNCGYRQLSLSYLYTYYDASTSASDSFYTSTSVLCTLFLCIVLDVAPSTTTPPPP